MPRKAKKQKIKKLSQKMQIQRRLMEMELRVDRHVYGGRELAAREAGALAREARALRPACGKDVRLLQVADKLIRIMNSILEGVKSSQEVSNLPDVSFPPTTCCINSEHNNLNTESNGDETQINDFENDIKFYNNSVLKTNGHTATKNVISTETSDINCTTNICRAISNLSIEETVSNQEPTQDDITESQSILNNFDKPDGNVQSIPNNFIDEAVAESNMITTNNKIFEDLTEIEISQYNIRNDVDTNTGRLSETITHASKLVTRNKQTQNKCSTKTTKKETKEKALKKHEIDNHTKIVRKSRAKKTQVDMSWVENIKYVRVIEDVEYTPAQGFADSFWSTRDLPPDWDESDVLFPY